MLIDYAHAFIIVTVIIVIVSSIIGKFNRPRTLEAVFKDPLFSEIAV